MFGTTLRALLQRRRNRDLFDLVPRAGTTVFAPGKDRRLLRALSRAGGNAITRAMAEQRMLEKLRRSLMEGVAPALPAAVRWSNADAIQAFERVWTELIANIRGDRWKLADTAIEELRAKRYPGLLMQRRR